MISFESRVTAHLRAMDGESESVKTVSLFKDPKKNEKRDAGYSVKFF